VSFCTIVVISGDQLPLRTALLKYCDLKNISPDLLRLLRKHSPEGDEAMKLDSLLADGVRFVATEFLARDVIYTSRAYAIISVSICLSVYL